MLLLILLTLFLQEPVNLQSLAEALIRHNDDMTLERGTVIEIILDRPIEF